MHLLQKRKLSIMKRIYKLELGEWLHLDSISVLRVPEGWIFYGPADNSSGTFVPFSNEF